MSIEEYSKRSEEEVVRAFKSFIKVMIVNNACNFKRRFYAQYIPVVPWDEYVDKEMSLSVLDDDIFFSHIDEKKDVYHKYIKKYKFSEREKQVLKLILDDYTADEIMHILKITDTNYRTILKRMRKKIGAKGYEK